MEPGAGRVRRAAALLALIASGCATLERARAPWADVPGPPGAAWTPPPGALDRATVAVALADPEGAATPAGSAPAGDRAYDLPALIDLAERRNPETRRAWEQARAAAARLGQAESAYLPTLALAVIGSRYRINYPTPRGRETARLWELYPELSLGWLLLDFGGRTADTARAEAELLASRFALDRRHQELAFAVQRSFYAFDARRAQVDAARATLVTATTIHDASEARGAQGLATRPEILLARQEQARAAFELERALGRVEDARAELAEAIAVSPARLPAIAPLGDAPLPAALAPTVERVLDAALAHRPDLAARVADLRAREATVARARSAYWPTVRFLGDYGGLLRNYSAGPPFSSHHDQQQAWSAGLAIEWTLFDGFRRDDVLRAAEAEAGAARAGVTALELQAEREVWKAYFDARTALRKQEFAAALLAASTDAYESTLASYRSGLGTLIDLLAAQRDLAQARTIVIESRAELLTASAALAFATGDLPPADPAGVPLEAPAP